MHAHTDFRPQLGQLQLDSTILHFLTFHEGVYPPHVNIIFASRTASITLQLFTFPIIKT